jgi:hypothetical protein
MRPKSFVKYLTMILDFQTMYREPEGATKPVQDLDKTCSRIPVSIVFGGENDYLYAVQASHLPKPNPWHCRPRAVHDALINPASGRRFSCITRIDGAGHLVCSTNIFFLFRRELIVFHQVPQQAPDQLGESIFSILSSAPYQSKL